MIRRLAIVLCALWLAGCATPEVGQEVAPEFASEGLVAVSNSGFNEAYVLPDAGLPGYREVAFDPLDLSRLEVTQTTVTGTTRNQWQLTPEREQALIASWQGAATRAFDDYPREGDKARLTLSAALLQVAPGRGVASETAASGAPIYGTSDVVDISAEFRVHDADSGQLLAVIRDRRTIASLQWGRAAGPDLADLFNRWAALMHTRVSGR
ncbi:hypothetical protein GCM10007052_01120 [Halioglobus japonicus]|uniref:DUF3313 domain-containing protein n=1 Tax=Halioglobus japonicus TaxID=930805 RepID=A0AAP8MH83_9GAMM|nr:DUF3313 family protein [Halioglobus japonicus]PLW87818.1 DUF3313 domain-containing protein [Halioglobus japonicus]GHD06401.1 hypothetical protein GCM10007052_01120 [Halioglobus japonicus]